MKKLLRAAVTISALSLVLFFGVGLSVGYAQTNNTPPATTPPTTQVLTLPAGGKSITDPKGDGRTCKEYPRAFAKDTFPGFKGGGNIACLNTNGTLAICTVTTTDPSPSSGIIEPIVDVFCDNSDSTQSDSHNTGGVGTGSTIDAERDQAGNTTYSSPGSCDIGCMIGKIPGLLFAGLGFLLLTLSSLILGIAGTVFNWVVIRTVFQFALYFGTSAGMLVAWGVLRDIANIALLFGFIFVGIATILNTQSVEGYTAKKALPRLIIFAVLLNFSLFATQAIIDVANGFSSVFAAYAGQEQCNQGVSSTGNDGQALAACANIGISSKILEAAGMHQIFPHGDQAGKALTQAMEAPYTYTVMMIMLSLMVTVTAMVLIAATIMLVVRVVVLSLLMVTSPIGFAGMAIPSLNKIAQDWWHKLINQAFFAPLFLLMIFVSLKLVEGLQSGEATIADAILGNTGSGGGTTAGNMQVVMVFMIVIGFMIGALMIAQKMGAYGAGFAVNSASAIVYGGLARMSNIAAGGGARGLLALQRKTGLGGKTGNRIANTAYRMASTANLDVRRAGVGALLGVAGATAGAKPAEHVTYGDIRHQVIDVKEGKWWKEQSAQSDRDEARFNLERNAHSSPDGALDAKDTEELQKLSTKQLEELHGIKTGVEALAQNLKQDQYDALMKSDKLTDGEKGALAGARGKRFDSTLVNIAPPGAPPVMVERAKRTLNNMSLPDIAALSGNTLTKPEVMRNLTGRQLASLDPDKLKVSDAALITAYIAANAGAPEIVAFHAIAGRRGPAGILKGTNPLASRRWASHLP